MSRKTRLLAAALAALVAAGGYGLAVRLRQDTPGYGWLVFGPTAEVRVLVTVAGDSITLRHFAGETPTGRVEQFKCTGEPLEITLTDPDGVASYVIRRMSVSPSTAEKAEAAKELIVNVDVHGPVEYKQYSDMPTLAREPTRALVSHFHGPLAIGPVTNNWEIPPGLALRRGPGNDLRATVGTMDAARGCWVVVKSHEAADECLFPSTVRPVVDVEYPPKRAGGPPVQRRYRLDQFC